MKKFVQTTFGVLYLWAAIAIFVWDVGKLRQARYSRDWPQVEGRVTRSTIDDGRRDRRPHVVYTYTVAGTPYTSSQISFDLFDKPGGEGRIESIIGRYPAGQKVTVYFDPTKPATAILEPEVYSPFFMPLFFSAFFFFGGSFNLWKAFHLDLDGRPVCQQLTSPKHHTLAAATVSTLIYIMIVTVSFDSAVRGTFVKAFGEHPAGIPNILFVLALQTLLYLPMPWVLWHGMRLTFQALHDGRRIGIGYGPDDRRYRRVVVDAGGSQCVVLPSDVAYNNVAACVGSGTVSSRQLTTQSRVSILGWFST